MTDIVERLRACHGIQSGDPECCCAEAADEIKRLRAENKWLYDQIAAQKRTADCAAAEPKP